MFRMALLTALLALAACTVEADFIPPCTPVQGSAVDPCDPEASPIEVGGAPGYYPYLGPAPMTIRQMLDDRDIRVRVTHVVLRGTYLPNTVRCTAGDPYTRPSWFLSESPAPQWSVKCYVDVRANDYVVGRGPATVTVVAYSLNYFDGFFRYPGEGGREETARIERVRRYVESLANASYPGREQVLFLGPPTDISSEVWRILGRWDVLRKNGTVTVRHPNAGLWSIIRPDEFETHRATLLMELPAFKSAAQTAHQARVREYGGRIGPATNMPMLVTDVNQLSNYYDAVGASNAVQPPPACGLVVPDQASNPGFMLDCMALLEGKDALRGAGALNWGVDTTIADWDGVTVAGTPQRVTELDLRDKGLTGSIPAALAKLDLTTLKLAGNFLTGCIPPALRDVDGNDLDALGLLHCPAP